MTSKLDTWTMLALALVFVAVLCVVTEHAEACTVDEGPALVVGDSLEVLRLLPDECVDVCVTSPPYNIGLAYGVYADKKPHEAYLAWLQEVFAEVKRVLKPNGSLFLNVGATSTEPWKAMEVAFAMRGLMELQNTITWVKSVSIGDKSHGHFKPVNSARFLNNTSEQVFHFTKTGAVAIDRLAVGVPFIDKRNTQRFESNAGKDLRCAGNVWFVPYETRRGGQAHLAAFPVALAERCIKLHGGGLVLDPFVGSGTTAVAAQQLGHECIGIDLDEAYVAMARERLVPAQG